MLWSPGAPIILSWSPGAPHNLGRSPRALNSFGTLKHGFVADISFVSEKQKLFLNFFQKQSISPRVRIISSLSQMKIHLSRSKITYKRCMWTRPRGVLPIIDNTWRLRLKGVHFTGWRKITNIMSRHYVIYVDS